MKKFSFTLFVGLLVLILSCSVFAGGLENLEFSGGFTYNTFKGDIYSDNFQDNLGEEFTSGFGFYAIGEYHLNDKFALGFGFDTANANNATNNILDATGLYYDEFANINLYGPTLQAIIKPIKFIKVTGGLTMYLYNEKYDWNFEDIPNLDYYLLFSGSGLGGYTSLDISIPLTSNININASGGYRIAKVNIDKYKIVITDGTYDNSESGEQDYITDMSGLRLGLGLQYDF